MRVIIVGAGIIGTSLAFALSRKGAQVTLIDAAAQPAQGASGASFGWVNASFYLDDAHFALRVAGLKAWAAWMQQVTLPVAAQNGAIWWEEQGAGLDQMEADLRSRGYPVERLSPAEIEARAPGLAQVPDAALLFPSEWAFDAHDITLRLWRAAQGNGARGMFGVRVTSVGPGKVVAATDTLTADHIVLATGINTEALLAAAGHSLPMLERPGLIVRTTPQPPLSDHVLVTPDGEARQLANGALMMPGVVSHQGDDSTDLGPAQDMARDTIARWSTHLKDPVALDWANVSVAKRPVPGDNLPAIGLMESGLSVAVLHSGVTLAAITAEELSSEILSGQRSDLMAASRPTRFRSSG